jgi:tryptophan synthase alpha subunit
VNCPIREDFGDGIRVGSALVRLVERDGAEAVEAVEAVRGLTAQLRDEWQIPQ